MEERMVVTTPLRSGIVPLGFRSPVGAGSPGEDSPFRGPWVVSFWCRSTAGEGSAEVMEDK